LHLACGSGRVEVMEVLLAFGANIQDTNNVHPNCYDAIVIL